MKFTYIIVGAAIIGIGVCGYCFLQKKKKQDKDKNEVSFAESSSRTFDFVEPDIVNTANQSFSNIANNHQAAAEVLKETVEEIKIINNEAEQKKKEIDELLNDLSK